MQQELQRPCRCAPGPCMVVCCTQQGCASPSRTCTSAVLEPLAVPSTTAAVRHGFGTVLVSVLGLELSMQSEVNSAQPARPLCASGPCMLHAAL